MKITNISTRVVNARMRNWIFVKVETSEPGLWGWRSHARVEDARRPGRGRGPGGLADRAGPAAHRTSLADDVPAAFWRDGVTGMSALSGIDQALWDIKGKEAGKPVCELLGGPVRDTLRYYDHLGGGSLEGMYRTGGPEQFAESIRRSMEAGFTAVKAMPIPVAEMIESPGALRQAARCVEAMREAAGDRCDILLDLHARTTPAAAIQFGRLLTDYNLFGESEERAGPSTSMHWWRCSRALPFPIATGERLVTRWQFREICEKRAVAILQPDVSHCGGISEALADRGPRGNVFAIHGVSQSARTGSDRGDGAGCVCDAQLPDSGSGAERRAVAERRGDGADAHRARHRTAATLPGLGIEVNEAEAAKHPFAPEVTMDVFHRDGSVADW